MSVSNIAGVSKCAINGVDIAPTVDTGAVLDFAPLALYVGTSASGTTMNTPCKDLLVYDKFLPITKLQAKT